MGFRHGRRRSDALASAKVARADGSGQKIAVPSYLDPGSNPEDWNALIDAQTSKVGVAIANVLNGPTYQRDQQWADVIHRARASGKRVLGYVDTGCLGRTGLLTRLGSAAAADWIAQIEQDVNLWYRFYGDDLGGIFYDQGFNECGIDNIFANCYSLLNQYVKRHHGGSMTVLNPGTPVPRCYENTADVLVTYEGDGRGYFGVNPASELNFEDSRWVPSDPDKFWHIVYDVSADQVADVIAESQTRGAGYVYVTDGGLPNPYDAIPTYWRDLQATVAGGAITPAPAAALPTGKPVPSVPLNLTVMRTDYTSATLRWTAAANAANYFVYLAGRMVAKLPATLATQVTIAGLVPGGKDYLFHVAAQGRSGQLSAPSNGADARTAALPDGQTITGTATHVTRRLVTYSAEFLTPYAFRRVFIPDNGLTPGRACWHSTDGVRARYLIENSTLLVYAGDNTGTQWQWTPIAHTPPTISGYTYSWTVKAGQVNGASADVQMNADGIGPATYIRAGNPDHRNGASPGAALTAVAAAVGSIATIETGGAAAPEAVVLVGEFGLPEILVPMTRSLHGAVGGATSTLAAPGDVDAPDNERAV
jgi:hypothetical protein